MIAVRSTYVCVCEFTGANRSDCGEKPECVVILSATVTATVPYLDSTGVGPKHVDCTKDEIDHK